jgi:hypothetical protein
MILSSSNINTPASLPTHTKEMRGSLFERLCVQTLCIHSLHLTFWMLLAYFSPLFEFPLVYCRYNRYCCSTITVANPVKFSDYSLQTVYTTIQKFTIWSTTRREILKLMLLICCLSLPRLPHIGRGATAASTSQICAFTQLLLLAKI